VSSLPPRLSEKEWLIINHLMIHGESYGQAMADTTPGLSRGTVYVTLQRLETKGLVHSRQEFNPHCIGSPRRFYVVTPEGTRIYHALELARQHVARK
jgi:DNA-binding PadR family transcriptional regulator